MRFEQMPQGQDKVIHYADEVNGTFESLVLENCYNQGCEIINKDNFVRRSLLKIKEHDMNTFIHSLEVGNIAAYITNKLGNKLNEEEKRILMTSALLHDYGKTSIDAEILNKRETLTSEERQTIETHPKASFNALKDWDIEVAKVAVAHHEHQKHSYPRKNFLDDVMEKRAEDKQVNKLSRILAIMDSFQAMIDPTRPSSIRNPKTIDEIVSELNQEFVLSEDKEIIFLLETYYYEKEANKKMHNLDDNLSADMRGKFIH